MIRDHRPHRTREGFPVSLLVRLHSYCILPRLAHVQRVDILCTRTCVAVQCRVTITGGPRAHDRCICRLRSPGHNFTSFCIPVEFWTICTCFACQTTLQGQVDLDQKTWQWCARPFSALLRTNGDANLTASSSVRTHTHTYTHTHTLLSPFSLSLTPALVKHAHPPALPSPSPILPLSTRTHYPFSTQSSTITWRNVIVTLSGTYVTLSDI